MGRLGTGMPSSPRSRCYCAPHAPESRESDCMHTVLMHAAPALRHSRASRICGERGVGDALDGFCRLGVVYLVGSDSADPGSRKLVRGVALPGLTLTHSTAPRKRPARSRGKNRPGGCVGCTPYASPSWCGVHQQPQGQARSRDSSEAPLACPHAQLPVPRHAAATGTQRLAAIAAPRHATLRLGWGGGS